MGVRTAQRKEHKNGLPVRRPTGAGPKEPVFALRSELDRWKYNLQQNEKVARELNPSGVAQAADMATLKHISSLDEIAKLYRRNYFMRFDLRSRQGSPVF